MLRSFLLLLAFLLFTAQGVRLGETTLAANAVLMHFFIVAGYFLDGLATAAEQVTGRSIGARYQPAFRTGLRLVMFWDIVLAILLWLTMFAAGESAIALMTSLPSVREAANGYMWLAAFTPVTGVVAFVMDGVFLGATWSRELGRMMILSFLLFAVALYGLSAIAGNTGIWLALHIFLIVRGVLLLAILPRKEREAFAPTVPANQPR